MTRRRPSCSQVPAPVAVEELSLVWLGASTSLCLDPDPVIPAGLPGEVRQALTATGQEALCDRCMPSALVAFKREREGRS